ncbi:unnamed protein product [Closterium sp. NIES-64]|nr:unnamed protein product [Closterium sp. NIES-64]
MRKLRVLIVGAGIGGCTLSLALRQITARTLPAILQRASTPAASSSATAAAAGSAAPLPPASPAESLFEATVFEQAPQIQAVGAGLSLGANGLRVLDGLGLYEKIQERGGGSGGGGSRGVGSGGGKSGGGESGGGESGGDGSNGANGLRVLDELGLYEKIQNLSGPISSLHTYTESGRKLRTFDYSFMSKRYGYPMMALERAELQGLLVHEVMSGAESASVPPILFNKKCISVQNLGPGKGVRVQIEDGMCDVRWGMWWWEHSCRNLLYPLTFPPLLLSPPPGVGVQIEDGTCEVGDVVVRDRSTVSLHTLGVCETAQCSLYLLSFLLSFIRSVRVHFEDGTCKVGDVVVGADGVKSAVRSAVMPRHDPHDRKPSRGSAAYSGISCILGVTSSVPDWLKGSAYWVLGPGKVYGTWSMGRDKQYWFLSEQELITADNLAMWTPSDALKGMDDMWNWFHPAQGTGQWLTSYNPLVQRLQQGLLRFTPQAAMERSMDWMYKCRGPEPGRVAVGGGVCG